MFTQSIIFFFIYLIYHITYNRILVGINRKGGGVNRKTFFLALIFWRILIVSVFALSFFILRQRQIFFPVATILVHYFQQDSLPGYRLVINCFIYNHLKKYHSSHSEMHSPYLTTQCLRELKNVNTIALKFLNIIIYQCIHLPFVALCHTLMESDLISSVTASLQRNIFVFPSPTQNSYLMKQLITF